MTCGNSGVAAPTAGTGDFVVIAAHRDRAVNNAQGAYQEDDPQLVGRLVHIGPDGASFDGDAAVCRPLTFTTRRAVPLGVPARSVRQLRAVRAARRFPPARQGDHPGNGNAIPVYGKRQA
jgi:hypothetical protein